MTDILEINRISDDELNAALLRCDDFTNVFNVEYVFDRKGVCAEFVAMQFGKGDQKTFEHYALVHTYKDCETAPDVRLKRNSDEGGHHHVIKFKDAETAREAVSHIMRFTGTAV